MSLALLRNIIRKKRHDIDSINQELRFLHVSLANKLDPLLWNRIEQLAFLTAESDEEIRTKRQCEKFSRLEQQQLGKSANHHLETKKGGNQHLAPPTK
ncbi:hypothetical protein QE152_g38178 [Popillia japonica]|uniref:Uncharacterized protein n=1 Tax=Popillia japonica TaxID=7064 RepID=A0AAW1I7N8_POPJA